MPSFWRFALVLIEGSLLFSGQNGFLDCPIRANTNVVGPADVNRMHDVIENMNARRHGGRGHDIGHQIDAKIAAVIGERLQDFVGLVAGMRVDRPSIPRVISGRASSTQRCLRRWCDIRCD